MSPYPPLGLVDDLITISTCGLNTTKINEYINIKSALKRLQFGTAKCIKLHVDKTCNETLCKDLFLDDWKLKVERNDDTGEIAQAEYFGGVEKLTQKQEQKYLGDIVSADGKQNSNILARKNKGLGIINQIEQILDTVFYGKYHFEVAMILRSSLFLSAVLLNSEAWVNLTHQNIRTLEKTDEILLSRILGCEANTSNAYKYLELGIYPIRFEIMKRNILFLQYILQQDENSMMYQVFKAICDNPIKNDFVKISRKYLSTLNINLSFEQIAQMSKNKFKKIVKQKTMEAAFNYLIVEKNKQTKICNIEYRQLNMQEYLLEGNKNIQISKLIFKARGKTLDIKTYKKWKYDDDLCVGCGVNVETVDEILTCTGYSDKNDTTNKLTFSLLYSDHTRQMVEIGKVLQKKLKMRQKIIEGIT